MTCEDKIVNSEAVGSANTEASWQQGVTKLGDPTSRRRSTLVTVAAPMSSTSWLRMVFQSDVAVTVRSESTASRCAYRLKGPHDTQSINSPRR